MLSQPCPEGQTAFLGRTLRCESLCELHHLAVHARRARTPRWCCLPSECEHPAPQVQLPIRSWKEPTPNAFAHYATALRNSIYDGVPHSRLPDRADSTQAIRDPGQDVTAS